MDEQARKQHRSNKKDPPITPRRWSGKESQIQIAGIAVRLFTENRLAFWSSFPELANAIEQHLQASTPRRRTPVFEGYMTEREREFKLRSLSEITERYKTSGALLPEEAHRALALAGALREHAVQHKNALLEVVERVLGLPLDSLEPQKVTVLKGKSEHHTFDLVLGVTLSLAWDGALLAISLNPEEYQRRKRALSFVGMASDTESDVAENHDQYLWDAPDAG